MSPRPTLSNKRNEHYEWSKRPSSVADFLAVVNSIQKKWEDATGYFVTPWFRGQVDAGWGLVPSAYRDKHVASGEDDFRHDFKMKAYPFLSEATYPPQTDWDWYFLMQHHGLPTRLLDWSEGCLAALYFALRDSQPNVDLAVWVLNPWTVNRKVSKLGDFILIPTDKKLFKYLPPTWSDKLLPLRPAAIQPPFNSKRITAQKGMFTVHGRSKKGLEKYDELKGHLCKVVISHRNIGKMMDQLELAGITESTVFPDLTGLCRELREYWKER